MDVTCEVNEGSAHKVELAENVQNIRIVFYRSKHMERYGSQKVIVARIVIFLMINPLLQKLCLTCDSDSTGQNAYY